MKRFLQFLFFSILICKINPATLHAQDERPKIGLVLSGGGAKGIAHIGVLKAMEEAGLTPDYITGTSMGSIVGALYAAGYSADELREIVESADWDLLLSNKVPYDKVTFEEKYYYGRYLIDFYMDKGKLLLPKGIIEGQALMELFSDITRPVHGITDFNNLPIPFACVATNIVTGEAEILNKGSLASSMRASMAIPSIFTPVKIDNKLLVDGGLVRNMPVDEALDMGADIIIGVFVSSDLDPEEKLTSALAILSQSAFITSAFDTREQLKKCDILVQPDLKDFSTGSFKEATAILEKGDEAGQAYLDQFRQLADSLKKIAPLHVVKKPVNEQSYIFSEILVEGNFSIPDEYIIGKAKVKTGKEITVSDLTNRLTLINGTQYFEKIWYEILGDSTNRTLKLHVVERPKIQFRFSYHYDTENKGGVVGNMTLRNFLLPSSRFILEADLATYPRVTLDYFKYIGRKQNFALGASGVYVRDELPNYDSIGNSIGILNSTYSGWGFKFQTTSFLNSAFGVDVNWTNANFTPQILESGLRFFEKIQYSNTRFGIYYNYNSFNTRYFPKRGLRAEIKLSQTTKANGKIVINDTLSFGADELSGLLENNGITAAELTLYPILPIGKKFSILSKTRVKVSTLDVGRFNFTEYDFIGGVIPKTYNSHEYMGVGIKEFGLSNYFFTRIGFQWEIKDKFYFQGHFNYIDAEYPSKWINPNVTTGKLGTYDRRFSYGVQVGTMTPVGPIAVALARDHYRKDLYSTLILGFYY